MFDQLFDGFRKASESSIMAQQEMLKQWVQQWPSASLSAASTAIERNNSIQKLWVESAAEALNRQRELLNTTYRAGMNFVEQSARISDAKSPDDYRRMVEDLWRKMFESLKDQTEAQLQDLRKTSSAWIEVAQVPMKVSAFGSNG